jgi:hypothetical protein
MSERLCPILATNQENGSVGPHCIAQRCAWWDMNVEQCAVLHASVALENMRNNILSVTAYTGAGRYHLEVQETKRNG